MRKIRKQKAKEVTPVTFAPINHVFKPQIQVRALRDIAGWADYATKTRYSMKAYTLYYISEDKAREFEAKGYVEITKGKVKPVSDAEREQFLSEITNIGLGGQNG